jgi:MFS family permease
MHANRPRTLTVLLVTQVVVTTGLMTLVPILPLYLQGMAGTHDVDWSSVALAAPAIGALAVAPFTGFWCDRLGHRTMLQASLAVFTLSVLILAASHHIASFLFGRVLQGASAIGVLLTACISHVSAPASRNRAFGLQESAVAAGALLGPVLGGVLQDVWSPRPMLFAVAALNAALTLVLSALLRDMPAHDTPAPATSVRGAVREVLILRRWLAAACLSQAGAFALVNVFVLYLQQRFPHDTLLASKAGTLHALGWFAAMLASPWWGARNDRATSGRHFLLAASGCAIAMALLPLAATLWQIALLRVIHGALFAALALSVLAHCHRTLPRTLHGTATGVARSAMTAGQLVGPLAVMVSLPLGGPSIALWVTAALFAASALLVLPDRASSFAPIHDAR